MLVHNSGIQAHPEAKIRQNKPAGSQQFVKLMHPNHVDSQKNDHHAPETKPGNLIELGSLSKTNNTVAQLLLAHPQLKSSTWSIIHDAVNKTKAFATIPVGTRIYYNDATRELQWQTLAQPQDNGVSSQRIPTHITPPGRLTSNPASHSQGKIMLGELNRDNPTVANLLLKNDRFSASTWHIIHADINKQKAFKSIPAGSTVFIDSKTRELSWQPGKPSPSAPALDRLAHTDTLSLLSKKLDDAVKPFMGTPYKKIDCYTLVVHGLKNMGIRYTGQDGLSRQLLQRARLEGRPENAYFTGEGLSEALGEKVYTRDVAQVQDVEEQSRAIFKEMQNLMQKGDILSFSLETKGHTGVISQNKQQWTYINSGRLDNSIVANAPRHGVGEETLLKEISNWVKLAQKRSEPLQITIGRLDSQKLV